MTLTPALTALVALAPGVLVWLWGRRLVRSAGDPTLPERVHAWRRQSLAAAVTGITVLVFFPSGIVWALPLLLLAYLTGGFPVRRALFGETWGLAAYVAHVGRAFVGLAGFWVVVMAAPGIVSRARPGEWAMAGVLASLLLVWGILHDRVLLRLLRATPLRRPDLEPLLTDIASRSSAPMPRLFVVGPPGGRWANGLALPSTGRPAVVLTRTLLEELDSDEVAAIFAHEQAHLEHFHRRRVIRLGLIQAAVVLLGTLGAAATFSWLGDAPLAVTVGWPLVVALALVIRLARHQAHEADSDRRAAELCGDPAALARGLVKLHQLALFPRRLDPEREQWESHPSLASRLRALGALTDETARAVGVSTRGPTPVCLAGAAAGAWVVLEEEQAHWLEQVLAETAREPGPLRAAARRARTLAYDELVELRLRPRGRDRHELVATDRTGASWTLPLAPGQGHAAQETLDAIDERLSPPSAAPRAYRPVTSIVAAVGSIVALFTLSAALVPGLIAVFLPHPGPLAALGSALVVSALVSPLDGPGLLEGTPLALRVAVVVVLGFASLGLAWATAWRERAGRTRSGPWVGLLLSLLAAVPLLLILAPGDVLSLHVAARQHPAGTILLAGAAAAFLVSPRRWSRAAGAGAALVCMLASSVASDAFASRFVHDPLWMQPPPALPSPLVLRLVAEHPLPTGSRGLGLSPTGLSWVSRGYDDERAGWHERFVVGSAADTAYRHEALDVALLDDERLLALRESPSGLALVCGRHDPSAPEAWRHALPSLDSPRLAVDAAAGAWRVAGIESGSGELVRLAGDLEGRPPREDRWTPTGLSSHWLVGAGPRVLGVELGLGEGEGLEEEPGWSPSLWWLLAGRSGTRLLVLDSDGSRPLLVSHLMVQCDEPPPGTSVFVCRAHDGERTWLWSIDPAAEVPDLLGVVEGFATHPRPAGRSGLLLAQEGRRQSLYRLSGEGPVRLELRGGDGWVLDAAGFAQGVGVLASGPAGRPLLRLYAPDPGAATP